MGAIRQPQRRHTTTDRKIAWLRYLAFTMAALLGVATAYPLAALREVQEAIDDIEKVDVVALVGEQRPPVPLAPIDSLTKDTPVNILLMGSDVRSGKNGAIGGRVAGGMRNDTTIIMHISADRSRVELISIPRDSVVRVPDCVLFDGTYVRGWTGLFNIAFANGGRNGNAAEAAACTIRAVEELTGIYIHYYAVVDFYGFQRMIDSIGGVPMCIPTAIYAPKAKLNIKAGPQVLNGKTALAYARLRTATSSNGTVDGTDPQRIERQQELLAKVAETALEQGILFKPDELGDFLSAGAEYITMSPELADLNYLVALAYSLRHIDKDKIIFKTVPWYYRGNSVEPPGGLGWTPEAYRMFDSIIKDKPVKGKSVADTSKVKETDPDTTTGGTTPDPSATVDPGLDPFDLLGKCNVGKRRG